MKDFIARLKLNTGDFDQNTKKVIGELKSMENIGGKSLQALTKSFGPLLAGFTALNVASKIFDELKENSVSFAKAIDSNMFMAESAVNSFFKSVSNGDITGFLNNMDTIVSKAKQVYEDKYVRGLFNADKGAFQSEINTTLAGLDSQRKNLKYELETGLNSLTGEKTGRSKEEIQKDFDEVNKQYKLENQKQIKLFQDQQKFAEKELNSQFGLLFPGMNVNSEQYNNLNRQINTPEFDVTKLGQEYKEYIKSLADIDKQTTKYATSNTGGQYEYKDLQLQKQLTDELNKKNPNLEIIKAIKSLSPEERKTISDLNNEINSGKQGIISTIDRNISDADIQKQFNAKTPTPKAPKVETPKVIDARLEQIKVLEKRVEELYTEYQTLSPNDTEGKGKILFDITNVEKTINELKTTKFSIQEILDELLKLKEAGIVLPGMDESINQLKALGASIKEVKEKVKQKVDTTDYYGNLMAETEKLNTMVRDNLMQSFYQLGTAIGGTFGQVVSVISTSIQAVSSLMGILEQAKAVQAANLAMTKAQTAAEGEQAVVKAGSAAAGAASSVASIPFIGPILAVAAIATVMAALLPLLSKHAGGGIIGGNSIVGDKQLVRVNSGEMILNQQQQANLFAQLHSQSSQSNNTNIRFRIEGSDLVGILDNYNKKHR